jgi:hypothetical protein
VLILTALVFVMFCLLVSAFMPLAPLIPALHYLLLLYQQRFNKRFTRRLKRKPVAVQKYRFNAKPQWVIDAVIYLKVFMPNVGVRSIANTFNRMHSKQKLCGEGYREHRTVCGLGWNACGVSNTVESFLNRGVPNI